MHTATPDMVKGKTGEVKEGQPAGYAEGGKVHKMTGHAEGTHEHHKAMAKHYAQKCKEGGSAHMHKMMEHHKHMAKMCKEGGYATGGAIPSETRRGTPETTMVDEAKRDTAHGTGGVRMGNAGGFKHGGKAKKMMGGGMMYAMGGGVKGMGVEGNVSTSKPGVTNTTTGEVKEANAGGYKKGGAPKSTSLRGGLLIQANP